MRLLKFKNKFSAFIVLFYVMLVSNIYCVENPDVEEKKYTYQDTLYVDSLNSVSFSLRNVNPASSVLDAKAALTIALQMNYSKGILNSYSFIGVGYRNLSDYSTAMDYYTKSYQLADSLSDKEQKAYALNNIGNLYYLQEEDSLGLASLKQAEKLGAEIGDKRIIAYCRLNQGRIYAHMQDWVRAINKFNSALSLRKELNELLNVANTLIEIAGVYERMDRLDRAIDYYNQALEIVADNPSGKNLEGAINMGLGLVYQKQGYIQKAIAIINASIKINIEIDDNRDLMRAYKIQAENYIKLNDYKNAYKYLELHNEVQNVIASAASVNNFARLRVKFETEKMERDNQILKQANDLNELAISRQRIIIYTGIALLVFLAFILISFVYGYRKNNKQNILLQEQKEEIENQRKSLFDLNATKDKFFSIIAHDLRSPYMNLINSSDLLENEYNELSDEDRLNLISSIKRSAKTSFELLDNLLLWARTQKGTISFEPVIFNITETVNRTIQLFNNSALIKKLEIKSLSNDNIPVYADIEMVNTVLRNLINNATKFTAKGGTISVEFEEHNGYVLVSVRDTGIGIEKDTLNKLFNIEEKHSSVGTDGEVGSGLGLVITKEFIEKNGGKIWVESERGKGSSFNFTLPTA